MLDIVFAIFARYFHVKLESHTIVCYGKVKLPNAVVTAPTIEVRVRIVGVQLNYVSEVKDCVIELGQSFVRNSSVV